MTNGEKYKNEILAFTKQGKQFAVHNGVPIACAGFTCDKCDLNHKNLCSSNRIAWLYEEYQEPRTINGAESCLLTFLFGLYGSDLIVYRRYDSVISFATNVVPRSETTLKADTGCLIETTENYHNKFVDIYGRKMFPYIKDKTTMTVGELLKLEVVE